MANANPPPKGVAFSFPAHLISQADTDIFKKTVTLAAGDIQVSKDGGQYANLATFPPAEIDLAGGGDSGTLWVVLTATEMNADVIDVLFNDVAGAEWQDNGFTIYTSAQTFDTTDALVDTLIARLGSWTGTLRNTVLGAMQALFRKDADATVPSDVNADLGAGAGVANNTTDSGEAIRDRGDAAWITATGFATSGALTTHDGKLDTVDGLVDTLIARLTALRAGYLDNLSGGAAALQSSVDDLEGRLTATRAGYLDNLSAGAVPTAAQNATELLDHALAAHDTAGTVGAKLNDVTTLGAGATTWTYTVTDSATGVGIGDVDVWVTSDIAGTTYLASGRTNSSGVVTFYLDAGVVYCWSQKDGYTFTNPDTETVS